MQRNRIFYFNGFQLAKASNAQIRERIEQVKSMIIDGFTHYAIVRYCSENYVIGSRNTEKYIAQATKEIEDEYAPIREREIAKHIARRDRMYRHSLAKKDFKTALAIDDSTVKLKGLLNESDDTSKIDGAIKEMRAKFSEVANGSLPAEEVV